MSVSKQLWTWNFRNFWREKGWFRELTDLWNYRFGRLDGVANHLLSLVVREGCRIDPTHAEDCILVSKPKPFTDG